MHHPWARVLGAAVFAIGSASLAAVAIGGVPGATPVSAATHVALAADPSTAAAPLVVSPLEQVPSAEPTAATATLDLVGPLPEDAAGSTVEITVSLGPSPRLPALDRPLG